MMNRTINMALQVLPQADGKTSYELVDVAIGIIQQSGVKYRVCPFETVMEGSFEELMKIVAKVHEACYNAGTENMMAYIKIESHAGKPAIIEEKMKKYELE
jgi:uncharacterized protein (TIGR00106 family)